MDKKERLSSIDTARAYLMMLVIAGHVLIVINRDYSILYLNCIQTFIYSFHMGAFFIIHGTLIDADRWKRMRFSTFIKKKVRTIVVPYIFFECIGIIWLRILWGQSLRKGLYNMLTVHCNIGADWFLPAMFLGDILALLCCRISKKSIKSIILCFSVIIAMMMPKGHFFTVLGRGLMAYIFIMTGIVGKSILLSQSTGKWCRILEMLLTTAVCAIINLKFGGNDFYHGSIKNPFTFLVAGVCGTCMILGMARCFSVKTLRTIGQHTLTIMGTHQLIIYAFIFGFSRERYAGSILYGLVLALGIVIIEIPIVYVIDRYFYYLVGKTRFEKRM